MKAERVRVSGGYTRFYAPEHPRASSLGYVLEHIVIVEAALGKALPAGAEVHHVNGCKSDNRPENMVLCPDRAYHMLLHRRARALDACGRADWRKCMYCNEYDNPGCMTASQQIADREPRFFHRECFNRVRRLRRSASPKGELNPQVKLTPAKVEQMRALYGAGGWTYAALGTEYGVSTMTALRAVKGESWK